MMLIRAIRNLAEARKMEKGDVLITRQLHRSDPEKDRTIIIIHGSLDARKAADFQRLIKGTHTAHRKPGKEVEA